MATKSIKIPQKGSDHPELKYLYRHVRDVVAEKWKSIGIELLEQKDVRQLNVIKANNAGNVIECCGEMLELWLHRQPEATWNQLIEALRAPGIKLNDVASEIEGMLESTTEECLPTKCSNPVLPASSSQIVLTFSPDQDIDYAFTRLSAAITNMIETVKFSKLKTAAVEKAMSPKSYMSKDVVPIIEAAGTFETLCNTLTKAHYWNFLDTRMMEAMVSASMVPAAQQLLEDFKNTFFSMKLSEVVPHYVPVIPLKLDHTIMEEVLDKDPRQLTIGELHKHRFCLETELLETGTDTLAYYKISVGSVNITWLIHVDHVYQAYSSLNKKQSQLSSQAITHMSIPEAEDWVGLPVLWRGQDLGKTGPIEASVHLRQEPYLLPEGLEWNDLNYVGNVNEIVDVIPDDSLRESNKNTCNGAYHILNINQT